MGHQRPFKRHPRTSASSPIPDVSPRRTARRPSRLRKLVEDAINRHMPKKLYTKLMKAEQDEQDEIRELVDQIS
jgi:hypothetical protein